MKDFNLMIEGMNVHYDDWGKNNQPTIVCLHGLGNSGAAFSELAEYLDNQYHLLSFDNPGHGRTSPFFMKTTIYFPI